MRKYIDNKTGIIHYEIISGESFATNEKNVVITTLVGSCITVCLRDEFTGTVGMNHFMLPGQNDSEREDLRYGQYAIDDLLLKMVELGAMKHRIMAKIFGGGDVVSNATIKIPLSNVDFVLKYLEDIQIPIVSSDLGGKYGRKVYFYQQNGKVKMKQILTFDMAQEKYSEVAGQIG